MTRRDFIAASAVALQAAPARPMVCVFSKHLADIPPLELGKVAKSLGFEGVDLTVRPKGHVLPEKVSSDLQPTVESIRAAGLHVPMITTDITTAQDPAARPTLAAMKSLKIPLYKVGYWRGTTPDLIKPKARALFDLTKEMGGVTAGLHNHSGDYYGAVPYEYQMLLDEVDPSVAGYYFDPGHSVIEGGLHGWQVYLRLAKARLRMVAIKDFYWEKSKGKWSTQWCPLGQGMVDWDAFFKAFAEVKFTGPLTLHMEYETKDERQSLAQDCEFMRKAVVRAYGA
jgi:L-ribulose-5-phosphate 3-epimerase